MIKNQICAILLLLPLFANATAMSPEKSKCLTIESKAQEYRNWSYQLLRYQSQYDNISEQNRFGTSKAALRKIIMLTKEFSRITDVKAPKKLIEQSEQFLDEAEAGHIPYQSGNKLMMSALHNYQDKMDDMLYQAQYKYPSCTITNHPIYTSTNGDSSGVN